MIENATGQSPGFRNEKNRLVTTFGVTEKIGHVGGLRDQPGQPPESGRAANRQRRPSPGRVPRLEGDGPHESGESGQNPEALRVGSGRPSRLQTILRARIRRQTARIAR